MLTKHLVWALATSTLVLAGCGGSSSSSGQSSSAQQSSAGASSVGASSLGASSAAASLASSAPASSSAAAESSLAASSSEASAPASSSSVASVSSDAGHSSSPASSAGASSSEPGLDLSAGLVAHYAFEDNLADSTGNFAAGVVLGNRPDEEHGAITYAAGVEGSALAFDGTSGVGLPAGLVATADYSVSLWFQADTLTDWTSVLFLDSLTNGWASVIPRVGFADSLGVRGWQANDFRDPLANTAIVPGEWVHVAFAVQGNQIQIYLNGELKQTANDFFNIFTGIEATLSYLAINWWDAPFVGLVDELRIYDRVLSAEEVAALAMTESQGASSAGAVSSTATSASSASSVASSSSSAAVNLAAGLVAHFAFEGDLVDGTGTFGAGSVTGDRPGNTTGAITYATGVSGSAAVFDGHSGVLLPANLITSHRYSVALWVHPDTLVDFVSVFFGDDRFGNWLSVIPQGADFLPGFDGNETMLRATQNAAWYEGGTGMLINTGEWSHFAFTVDNGQVEVYINGENRRSNSGFYDLFSNVIDPLGGLFTLGVTWWDVPFTGLLDELYIYDRPLSAEEVAALATAP